jgi:hypothetical protein
MECWKDFPELTNDDILACLSYAALSISSKEKTNSPFFSLEKRSKQILR